MGIILQLFVRVICLGPIHNIMANGWEITRSISCNSELSSNMSQATSELSLQPLGNVLADLQVPTYMSSTYWPLNAGLDPATVIFFLDNGERTLYVLLQDVLEEF